ncbi:MAG: hypothetical protein QOH63_3572 [Acidobacteriota bacterium]|jgi:protein CpxP|nr:hypothetical protein [Acidobacteriota bacterium]
MRNRIVILIGIAALIVGGVIFASAQRGPGDGGPPPPPHFGIPSIEHLARELNLTDAQTTELKAFLDTERPTIEGLTKKLDEAHKQLDETTANGHFDEAQVRALANQQAQTMADLIVEQERVKAKIYNSLTPEQRAKVEEMHKHGGPHGRRPGGPGEPPPPPPPGQ